MKNELNAPPTSPDVSSLKPNMRDVALAAGVGVATVSRVLNKSPLVAAGTAEHVMRVISELGYEAGPIEKRRGRPKKGPALPMKHGVVCMLFTGQQNLRWMTNCAPIYAYAVQSAEMALNKRGINCTIRHIPTASESKMLKDIQADGFLLLGSFESDEWPEGLHSRPGVKMLGLPEPDWYDCVTYNTYTIGKLAASYLHQRGIRHTAVLGSCSGDVFLRRIHSFSGQMIEMGGSVANLTHKDAIRVLPDMNLAAQDVVDSLTHRLLNDVSPRPKGIFVTSDVIVPAVYRSLERNGVAPGKDITIVSCNNEKSYLIPLHPQPAEIDIQAEVIGQQAVERLLWRMEHPESPRLSLIIEPTLLIPTS